MAVGWENIVGETSANLSLLNRQLSDNGKKIRCVITNAYGNVTSDEVNLNVNIALQITLQPIAQIVDDGNVANFSVTATGLTPISYQWYRNGSPIVGQTSNTLNLTSPYSYNGSNIYCEVSNSITSIQTDTVSLTVNAILTITTQPLPQTVDDGSDAIFTIAASGTPNITYQWQRNGIDIVGENATTLTLTSPYSYDGSTIRCAINNPLYPSTPLYSNSVALNVTAIPLYFTTQPLTQNKHDAEDLTLSVAVAGTYSSSVNYQWYKGVTPVGTNSNTFTIGNIKNADAASYHCVASDGITPDATSNNAVIMVYHWVEKTSNTAQNINKIFALDTSNSFAVCDNSIFLKSTNGGDTWAASTLPVVGNYSGVHFTSANEGWVCGYFNNLGVNVPIILKTINGGSTWVQQTVTLDPTWLFGYRPNDIAFYDSNNGWFGGITNYGDDAIFKTTDGGATWVNITFFFPESLYFFYTINDIVPISATEALFYGQEVDGHSSFIGFSLNGNAITYLPYNGDAGTKQVSVVGSDLYYTTGLDLIGYSSNLGVNRTFLDFSSSGATTGIFFTDAITGHSSTSLGEVFRHFEVFDNFEPQEFDNGGDVTTWISMASSTHGFISGFGGKIFKYQL
ncbi:MAG: hypothetical protein HC892_01570 [Saprospiraceae bacterium]|nr:hypothetical protein [Saprospiraceae bacterium]